MRRTVFAAAFGLTLLLGTPGHTQTAEAEALGVQVARTIFQAISFDKLIAKELGGASDAFADIKSRPEWSGYLIQAMQEEVRHDLPKFETMFGRALAKDMTVDELRRRDPARRPRAAGHDQVGRRGRDWSPWRSRPARPSGWRRRPRAAPSWPS